MNSPTNEIRERQAIDGSEVGMLLGKEIEMSPIVVIYFRSKESPYVGCPFVEKSDVLVELASKFELVTQAHCIAGY